MLLLYEYDFFSLQAYIIRIIEPRYTDLGWEVLTDTLDPSNLFEM